MRFVLNSTALNLYRLGSAGDFLSVFYLHFSNDRIFYERDIISNYTNSHITITDGSTTSIRSNTAGGRTNSSMGFKFILDGLTHYGWVRFNSTSNLSTVTLTGYGYETIPDEPIRAPGGGPLAVTLANFAAIAEGTDVSVTWSTVSEQDNLGFNLYRSTDSADLGTQLNSELIPAQAPGSGQGATYSYLDENLETGTYFYTLEDVDLNGSPTRHSPVSVTVAQPTAVALNQLESSDESSPLGLLAAGGALAAVALAARRRRSSSEV